MPSNNAHFGVLNSILNQGIDKVMQKITNLDNGATEMNNTMTVGHCVPLQVESMFAFGRSLATVHAVCRNTVQLDPELKGKERKGKERKGKERKGKERKGKERTW